MHNIENMTDTKILLGKRIREIRKENNMTQEYLAELIGIEPRNLIKIENGQSFPRVQTLNKLADIFNIEFYEMFKFNHLKDTAKLKDKIIERLNNDEKLVKLIYKMIF